MNNFFFILLHPKNRISTMKIGIFDSGYGGLTILSKIRGALPMYDYIYLGDNARTPYGTRSFEIIYEYTLEAVRFLQAQGCRLIILACNTASAKALRSIQMHNIDPNTIRVLGVIRPTVEAVRSITRNGHVGILATPGTVKSESYVIELQKQFGEQNAVISQQECPMWVPLIEAGEAANEGADYFVDKYIHSLLDQDPEIDTVILGCTHYPLLMQKIQRALDGTNIQVVAQGDIVAASLQDYLNRHTEIQTQLSMGGTCTFLTTEAESKFSNSASVFLDCPVNAIHVNI